MRTAFALLVALALLPGCAAGSKVLGIARRDGLSGHAGGKPHSQSPPFQGPIGGE